MTTYYLGLDIGTSGTKALLITAVGKPIATATAEYPLSTPRPQWAEQNPIDWWNAVVDVTRKVIDIAGIDGGAIAGVGLSGQMHGSVFLDKRGDVIRPAILWCDQQTQTECDWITEQTGATNHARKNGKPEQTGFT